MRNHAPPHFPSGKTAWPPAAPLPAKRPLLAASFGHSRSYPHCWRNDPRITFGLLDFVVAGGLFRASRGGMRPSRSGAIICALMSTVDTAPVPIIEARKLEKFYQHPEVGAFR